MVLIVFLNFRLSLARSCWKEKVSDRPTFTSISLQIIEFLEGKTIFQRPSMRAEDCEPPIFGHDPFRFLSEKVSKRGSQPNQETRQMRRSTPPRRARGVLYPEAGDQGIDEGYGEGMSVCSPMSARFEQSSRGKDTAHKSGQTGKTSNMRSRRGAMGRPRQFSPPEVKTHLDKITTEREWFKVAAMSNREEFLQEATSFREFKTEKTSPDCEFELKPIFPSNHREVMVDQSLWQWGDEVTEAESNSLITAMASLNVTASQNGLATNDKSDGINLCYGRAKNCDGREHFGDGNKQEGDRRRALVAETKKPAIFFPQTEQTLNNLHISSTECNDYPQLYGVSTLAYDVGKLRLGLNESTCADLICFAGEYSVAPGSKHLGRCNSRSESLFSASSGEAVDIDEYDMSLSPDLSCRVVAVDH